MCGIVGAVAQRDVAPILLECLRRLEYRGYDSAGIAVINHQQHLQRLRTQGKVQELAAKLLQAPLLGTIGIAHTRWATHGPPSETNAHPHISNDHVAVVHNGIIENHEVLREILIEAGYVPYSDTDSELVAHYIDRELNKGKTLHEAVMALRQAIKGAYALAITRNQEPDKVIVVRSGSPLVIGTGIGENFIASDPLALLPVVQDFIYLEEGDLAEIKRDGLKIFNAEGELVEREIHKIQKSAAGIERGQYRHYMMKEICEQPTAIANCLEGRLYADEVFPEIFGDHAPEIFQATKRIQLVACGTSYHAAMIARYWLEQLTGIACQVEIASEYRYRTNIVEDGTLFVTLSQSGETADTLAALHKAKSSGYLASLTICNVATSSLVRASDLVLLMHAGTEIGVASTKAFTAQLVSLLLLVLALLQAKGKNTEQVRLYTQCLKRLPEQIEEALGLDQQIKKLAERFVDKQHALYLGRGLQFPVALEGALKLKEISYIHAEAYPAGELKHGPLALVDKDMPVVTVAANDRLLEKLKSNVSEVRSRGGELIVFTDAETGIVSDDNTTIYHLPIIEEVIAPVVYTIPLQLLAYHVAVFKGTDVDQPRNLAKAVTVE